MDSTGDIVIYDAGDGRARLDVHLDGGTVWLTQAQMAELFGVGVPAVAKHIANIIDEDELVAEATISKMEQVRTEGVCQVGRTVSVYDATKGTRVGGTNDDLAVSATLAAGGAFAAVGLDDGTAIVIDLAAGGGAR